jgi:pimeloyl-ACP methyl ester carboxylesterase
MRGMISAVLSVFLAASLAAQDGEFRIDDGFIKTTDGVRIHYLEAGRGQALLFIPGFTGAAEFWEAQIRAFATSHRAIAMVPRSQGDSEKTYEGKFTERRAQDIRDVVNSLNLGAVVIVAWS